MTTEDTGEISDCDLRIWGEIARDQDRRWDREGHDSATAWSHLPESVFPDTWDLTPDTRCRTRTPDT